MRFLLDSISVFVSSAFLFIAIGRVILAGQYPIGMMVVLLAGIIQFCRAAADFARHFRKDE